MSNSPQTTEPSRRADRLPISMRLLFVSFALLALVIGAAIWGEKQANSYAEAAFETQRRELETVRMLSLLQDTETGQRGYLLTEDSMFLQPYEAAINEIALLRSNFQALVIDDDNAKDRAARLDRLITERLDLLARTIEMQETGDRQAALDLVKSGLGRTRMDDIRAIVAEVNGAREKLLAAQQANLRETTVWVRLAEILGVLVLCFTAAVIFRQSVVTLEAQRFVRESQEAALTAATAANHAKSAFLATMSHELRTPMTAIIGMCDLLLAGKQSADERQITQLLARNAQSLLRLLNDILDLSKIEAGRLTFETVDFKLSDVLEEMRSLFGPVASQKGLVLKVAANPGPKDVFAGDPKRLQQVLVNLVGNAIKFTLSGSITVSNRQTAADGGRTLLEIEVEDTGEGISVDAMKRLFREFEQEDVSTSRRYGGSGLGLSISKRIVEALGGSIGATSAKGRGSCFYFSLPLADGDPARVEARVAVSGIDAGRQLEGFALDILLAEDTPATQFLVTRMLSLWGHKVTTASNGEEAVARAGERRWDIILMDMQMPILDGPQATEMIRKGGGPSADVPIIALTADAVIENRRVYLAAGCNVVATKPIDWAVLAGHIAALIGRAPAQNMAPAAPTPLASEDWHALPLLDRSLIEELLASLGKETLLDVLTPTLDNLKGYITRMKQLVAAGEREQARRLAHQIKGAASQVGAQRLAGLARLIEHESGADAAELTVWMDRTLTETKPVFTAFFANLDQAEPQ